MSDKWKHDNWHNHQANRQKCGKEEIEKCPWCRIRELEKQISELNGQIVADALEREAHRLTKYNTNTCDGEVTMSVSEYERLLDRISELESIIADCEPYLKDGETPAQCIQRNRDDANRVLKVLAAEWK